MFKVVALYVDDVHGLFIQVVLMFFVVPECRNLCNEDRLSEEIIKILPKNEVPKKIIFTDALPLLSSGKTDRLRVKKLLTMESLGNE